MKPLVLVGVTLCLFAAGCDDSKNPLSDPKTAKIDQRLAGVWRMRDANNVVYYHVGQTGEDEKLPRGVLRVVEVAHSEGKVQRPEEYLVFSTTLGGKTYLNATGGGEQRLKLLEEKGWKPEVVDSYFIWKYQVDGDKLLIWMMDDDAKRQAIKAGKIKGVIEKGQDSERVLFTDTSEKLARFVTEAGDSLFEKEPTLRYERIDAAKKP